MWMPERAWVSTSSVRKTLVTPSSLMRESGMGVWVGGLKKGRNGRQQKQALARGVLGDKRDYQREDEHQGEHGAWTHKHGMEAESYAENWGRREAARLFQP